MPIQNTLTMTSKQKRYEHQAKTIQEAVLDLKAYLQIRAGNIQKKRSTCDDRAYWKTRGRQQILWRVSAHLRAMQAEYTSSYTLYLALKEYLDYCLEKCVLDVEEEKHPVRTRTGLAIRQWKAQGEAQELPTIRKALSGLLKEHTPPCVGHVLSLNGKNLVPLQDTNEDTLFEEGNRSEVLVPVITLNVSMYH
jgi:hypothetical protein